MAPAMKGMLTLAAIAWTMPAAALHKQDRVEAAKHEDEAARNLLKDTDMIEALRSRLEEEHNLLVAAKSEAEKLRLQLKEKQETPLGFLDPRLLEDGKKVEEAAEGKKAEHGEAKHGEAKLREAEHGEAEHGEAEHGEEFESAEEEDAEEEHEFSERDHGVATMLLGSVGFVMILFYLVNWQDDDIRRYSWSVISATIAIFTAVLTFQGIDEAFDACVFPDASSKTAMDGVVANYTLLLVLCIALIVVVAKTTGILTIAKLTGRRTATVESDDLRQELWVIADSTRADNGNPLSPALQLTVRTTTGGVHKSVATVDGREVFVQKLEATFEEMERTVTAWAIFFAHMGGFAAIFAGTNLMGLEEFSNVPMRILALFLNSALVALIFRILDKVASKCLRAHDHGHRSHLFREIMMESEADIQGLQASFLMVSIIRFVILGVLPNKEGAVPESLMQSVDQLLILLGAAVVIAIVATLVVLLPGAEKEDSFLSVLSKVLGNAFAWCILFGARGVSHRLHMLEVWDIGPFTMVGKIVLALVLCMISFLVIFVLDKIEDNAAGDATALKKVVQNIIGAISILVGFSWEQCFHFAVEANSSESGKNQLTGKLVATAFIIVFIVPAWRMYILRKVIDLDRLKKEKDKSTDRQSPTKARPTNSGTDYQPMTPNSEGDRVPEATYQPGTPTS